MLIKHTKYIKEEKNLVSNKINIILKIYFSYHLKTKEDET